MGFNLSECSSYLPTQRPANEMNRTAVVSHSLSREEISFPEKLFGCISQAKNATRQIATRRVANVHLIDRQCDQIVMIFLRGSLPTKEVQLNGIFCTILGTMGHPRPLFIFTFTVVFSNKHYNF